MIINAHKIKWRDQVFFKTAAAMQALAMPLKNYGIEHFSYQICHGKNVFEILTTHPNFSQLFIDEKFYRFALAGEPKNYHDGFVLAEDLGCPRILQAFTQTDHIENGIIIIKSFKKRTEIYYFGSTTQHKKTNSFFVNNLGMLNNFIKYFKENAADIFEKSSKQKLFYPNSRDTTLLTSDAWHENSFSLPPRDLKNYQLAFKLTPRELETLQWLTRGLSTKEIAIELAISHRTVEKFIINAKRKIGSCKTTGKLLCYLLGDNVK